MVNENSYAYAIIKKSLEQGVAQGLEQGLETLRESILKLILKRFQGTSESEAKKRLEAIEESKTLQSILDRAFDWQNFDDVWTTPETDDA